MERFNGLAMSGPSCFVKYFFPCNSTPHALELRLAFCHSSLASGEQLQPPRWKASEPMGIHGLPPACKAPWSAWGPISPYLAARFWAPLLLEPAMISPYWQVNKAHDSWCLYMKEGPLSQRARHSLQTKRSGRWSCLGQFALPPRISGPSCRCLFVSAVLQLCFRRLLVETTTKWNRRWKSIMRTVFGEGILVKVIVLLIPIQNVQVAWAIELQSQLIIALVMRRELTLEPSAPQKGAEVWIVAGFVSLCQGLSRSWGQYLWASAANEIHPIILPLQKCKEGLVKVAVKDRFAANDDQQVWCVHAAIGQAVHWRRWCSCRAWQGTAAVMAKKQTSAIVNPDFKTRHLSTTMQAWRCADVHVQVHCYTVTAQRLQLSGYKTRGLTSKTHQWIAYPSATSPHGRSTRKLGSGLGFRETRAELPKELSSHGGASMAAKASSGDGSPALSGSNGEQAAAECKQWRKSPRGDHRTELFLDLIITVGNSGEQWVTESLGLPYRNVFRVTFGNACGGITEPKLF